MNAKNFRAVILFMANQWTKEVAIEIWGKDLGTHFYGKWNAEDTPDMGTMRLFYEMTEDNLQKLLDYIEKKNNLEKSYTYKEMENAINLAADIYDKLAGPFLCMRDKAQYLVGKAKELDARLGGKNEDEGDYDYVEELEKFEDEVVNELSKMENKI